MITKNLLSTENGISVMAFNEFYFITSTDSSRLFHRGNKKKKKKLYGFWMSTMLVE